MSNANDTGIRWEEPPRANRGPGGGKWGRIVAELKKRPGQWALVAENVSSSTAGALKKGVIGGAQPGDLETRAVGKAPGKGDIYARWVGDSK